jgi:hypothetical protein
MTVCPGAEWTGGNRWRDLLFERITQIQQGAGLKSIRHYLLFGADAMTGDAYADALAYITRFRPTVGFSVEEARAAEFVTIAGGEAAVGAVGEQVLLQAGCRVERVAGRNDADTGALLADMARAGRRFRTFDAEF